MDQAQKIREQADKIAESGVLGRSRSYARLLGYLVECSARGHAPKEIEIATEVFGKDADFDPSQDSMVRVYAHNLRQKLEQFYAGDGGAESDCIVIPKGEYRVTLAPRAAEPEAVPRPAIAAGAWPRSIVTVPLLIALGLVIGLAIGGDRHPPTEYEQVAATPVWSPVLDDDLPILLVVGDYYIFGELDALGNVQRLVREFSINSSRDLDELFMFDPDSANRYLDLDLTYLARSTAFAMRDVLRVLYTTAKPLRVVSMSEFNIADLKTNHVVYLGYISALDKLTEFVFEPSGLAIGNSFDELWDKRSGETYFSDAGLPADYRNYRDYGLFSTFPGPAGNQIVVIAGMRDAGLMQSAQAVTELGAIRAAEGSLPEAAAAGRPAFELLFEVTGFDRTNLDGTIVYAAALDAGDNWSRDLSQAN